MKKGIFYPLIIFAVAASILFWVYMFQHDTPAENPVNTFDNGEISLTMYYGVGCQCCVRWAEYLENHGIRVINELLTDPIAFKKENGVPAQLRSCHTAVVDEYIVEGHVPVEDIYRLLTERPDAVGIAVPGMPPNSPGMDEPVEFEYHSFLFDREFISVFNIHK